MAAFYKIFACGDGWCRWRMGMDEPVRLLTTVILLASAAYVVLTNLQFRQQWPEMAARCRRRVTSLGFERAVPAIENDRAFMMLVASFGGIFSGAIAGFLFNAALMIFIAPLRVDHGTTDILVGAAYGAFAFAVLANQKT